MADPLALRCAYYDAANHQLLYRNTDGSYSLITSIFDQYIGLMSQVGTEIPTVRVLENTLGFDLVWDRDEGAGTYGCTQAGGFPMGKCIFPPFGGSSPLEEDPQGSDILMPIAGATPTSAFYQVIQLADDRVKVVVFDDQFNQPDLSSVTPRPILIHIIRFR